MSKKVSLKDIASAAGVSTALVSYVLNNKKQGRISKVVAEKIKGLAKAMNYRTNQIARSLKTNKTLTIGLILADIGNPFSAALARYIEDEADRHGYTVIFGSSDENPEKYKKILDTLVNRQADGLILSPPGEAAGQVEELLHQQLPFVLIDRYFPGIATNAVVLDNYTAAFDATQHLVNQGYKKVGMINYSSSLFHLAERSRGFREAVTANDLLQTAADVQEVTHLCFSEDIKKALQFFLLGTEKKDALLFGSNVIAMQAVKYINQLGLQVPGDIALACFDETDAFDLFYAPLTCIRQPVKEMAEAAVTMLLQNIANSSNKFNTVSFTGELIVRASTYKK
jgi:LacI family transcriptional regulator